MKAKEKQAEPVTQGRILVVEDEPDIQELLRFNLEREGYSVWCTDSGSRGIELATEQKPDLVLLDLMLPDVDGLAVCRALKADAQTRNIAVVMLTAKGEEADIVLGLEMGADDYVTKPFSPRVLLARLRAALRTRAEAKVGWGEVGEAADANAPLRIGDLELSVERHEVKVAGAVIDLTATEFKVLHMLARRPGRVFTRQQILESIHDGLAAVTDRSVDVQFVALRKKLGAVGHLVQTVRGVGYRFKEADS